MLHNGRTPPSGPSFGGCNGLVPGSTRRYRHLVAFSFRRVRPAELTPGEIERWRGMQQGNDALRSPYYCPEFSLIVGEQRPDAAVTVIEEAGRVVGFFPFQAGRLGLGHPIGGILSDHHGVITEAGVVVDIRRLLRASRLRRWTFLELDTTQPGLDRYARGSATSPLVDLSDGFDDYVAHQGTQTDFFRRTFAKQRRLERAVGPVRFEARTTSHDVLDQLRTWKSAQYIASGFYDLLAEPWVIGLTDAVATAEAPGFRGMLSALYVGDELIAAHLGMASSSVWHYWLPSYSLDYSRYSPGTILLASMIRHAPTIGLHELDLGTGEDPYKDRVANDAVELVSGSAEPTVAHRTVGRIADRTIEALRRSQSVRGVVRRARDAVGHRPNSAITPGAGRRRRRGGATRSPRHD